VVDALFSTSASSPTMPANYDFKRRIGAIRRVATSNAGFIQDYDWFTFNDSQGDVSASNPGNAAVTRTLSVPSGISCIARFRGLTASSASGTETASAIFSALTQTDEVPVNLSNCDAANGDDASTGSAASGGVFFVRTNTSSQIRSRNMGVTTSTTLTIRTIGWIDFRGK